MAGKYINLGCSKTIYKTNSYRYNRADKKGVEMDKRAVIKIVERFRIILEKNNIKINKIILYGSFANNTNNNDSDIDLIVISDDFDSFNYWERIDLLSNAIYKIFEPIEAFSFTTNEWKNSNSFLVDYAKNGEIIYAA